VAEWGREGLRGAERVGVVAMASARRVIEGEEVMRPAYLSRGRQRCSLFPVLNYFYDKP